MKRKHKNFIRCIISFVLMVAMAFGALPIPGVVGEVYAYFSNATYETAFNFNDNGTLTVYYNLGSNIPDSLFYEDDAVYDPDSDQVAAKTEVKKIIISNGSGDITGIGNVSFYGFPNVTSVSIPDTVTHIGNAAFADCTGLPSLTIPASVTDIGNNIVIGCSSLKKIKVDSDNPDYCDVDGVLFNKQKTELLAYPAGKDDSNSYTIPEGVTSIGADAFSGCSELTTITIPEGVTSIGADAFSGCSGLTTITIPEGVTSIGADAFSDCSGLTSITIPVGVTSIEDNTFRWCSGIASVTIPDKVESIGANAFWGCTNLKTLVFSNKSTSIDRNAFKNCPLSTAVYVPEGSTIDFSDTGYTGTPATYKGIVDPAVTADLVYNGNVLTGVPAGTGYIVSGNTATAPGSYTATVTPTTTEGTYIWKDGTTTGRDISWSIAKRPITIKAKDQTVELNGKISADVARAEITDGTLAEGDSIAELKLISTGTDNAVSDGTITAAAAVIKNQAGEDVTANYDISYVNGNLTVGKGEPSVTAPVAKKGLKALDTAQELVTAGKAEGGEMLYALGTDDKTLPTEGWSKEVPTAKDAGNYYVWYKVVGDKNHKDTEAKCVTVIMLKGHTDLKGISISENVTVKTGETMQLIVTYDPADASDKTVEWKSSDTDIATVDASGNVKGIKAGYAIVTATAKDGGYTASCKVEVNPAHTDDNAETTWISEEDLKDYKIPEEKKPEYTAESIKIGSKNDSKEVKVSISMNYMDAVTYNGKALTPKTSDEFKFELKLDDILTQAGVSGVKAEEIFKVSFVGKSKDAGEGTFYAKVSLVPKAKSKFKLTKQQEKDLKKIISAVNKVLKNKDNRVKFKINKASIAGLTDLQVYAKLTKDGKLKLNKQDKLTGIKSIKYKKTPADAKYTTLSKKAGYSVEAVDINTLEVRVTGTKNYTGWTTVKVSK